MKARLGVSLLLLSSCTLAHPMGNFSINHYARLTVAPQRVEFVYVLDFAEIPTFDLLRDWNLEAKIPRAVLESRAKQQASVWLDNLDVTAGSARVKPVLDHLGLVIADGAGNLAIMRVTMLAHLSVQNGPLRYEDRNFPDRAGWKEIVIRSSEGLTLKKASQTDRDISDALTHYPADPTIAPPQDLRAELDWNAEPLVPVTSLKTSPPSRLRPVVSAIPQPHSAPSATAPALMTKQGAPLGTVVRGDFLSTILRQRQITPGVMLAAIALAFLLGAAHALTPGHGKTIVAAYLVGARGTLMHAAFLGAIVTFTHTVSVFGLGLATLFLFHFVVPEKITQVLGAISGLTIVGVGAWMLYKRLHPVAHSHAHPHGDHHDHAHAHDHHHGQHSHPHTPVHQHGAHAHTHVPEEISWRGLVALGASGGLVPCESALVLLLGAIALGRAGLGLLLLTFFSLGLALVLMGIGILVLYAKNLLPERRRTGQDAAFRWIPVASAAAVIVVGLLMTGVSMGWLQPKWMIG